MGRDDGIWGLLPNSQKGMRFNTRHIWHYLVPYDAMNKPTGYSCYKKHGEYYSICRAGIPADIGEVDTTLTKPPYKDSCKDCVRIFNRVNSRPEALGGKG